MRVRLAHKMAHTKVAAWRWPYGESREVWKRRNTFLQAAVTFAPTMLEELRALQPLAQDATTAMLEVQWIRSRGVTWRHLDIHVSIMRDRHAAPDHNPWVDGLTDPKRRRQLFDLHEALLAWAQRWHMKMRPDPRCPEEEVPDWVLQTVFASLRDAPTDTPVQIRQQEFDFGPAINVPITAFEVEPWSGDEPANEWRERWLQRFDAHLRDHLNEATQVLNRSDLEPVSRLRSENTAHLQRAARWQVGGEDWDTFLTREKLVGRKASNVRDKIRAALELIGIAERPGMLSV